MQMNLEPVTGSRVGHRFEWRSRRSLSFALLLLVWKEWRGQQPSNQRQYQFFIYFTPSLPSLTIDFSLSPFPFSGCIPHFVEFKILIFINLENNLFESIQLLTASLQSVYCPSAMIHMKVSPRVLYQIYCIRLINVLLSSHCHGTVRQHQSSHQSAFIHEIDHFCPVHLPLSTQHFTFAGRTFSPVSPDLGQTHNSPG